MKTKKLFTNDAYLKECDAQVVEVLDLPDEIPIEVGQERKNRIIVLDQTVFYAMSGGQPGDTGTLDDERIADTIYATDEKVLIYHCMEKPTQLKAGDKVHCVIDWERRYRLMKMHSLMHIAIFNFERKHGKSKMIGSNMSDKGRFDYEFFDPIDVDWITQETQRMIQEGHQIKTYGDEYDEVKRIWEMEPLGTMPCGGTHVKNSSEIGKISLKRKGLSSQGQRVYCMLEE
ncbi:MAG: alanyl-tRNA editing protein [bacterium]|nr:alanyl-tRNA editing protein [bacterium]